VYSVKLSVLFFFFPHLHLNYSLSPNCKDGAALLLLSLFLLPLFALLLLLGKNSDSRMVAHAGHASTDEAFDKGVVVKLFFFLCVGQHHIVADGIIFEDNQHSD